MSIVVRTLDTETRDAETQTVPRDGYVIVCAGRRYVAHEQVYPRTGTVILTLKVNE